MHRIKEVLAFTLIELIVVISILVIITSSSVFYFFDFIASQELKSNLSTLSNQIKLLDQDIKSHNIYDYELQLNTQNGTLGYIEYTNMFDNDFRQVVDFDSKTGSATLNIIPPSNNLWTIKTYKNNKLSQTDNISSVDEYNIVFDEDVDLRIKSHIAGVEINTIQLRYFHPSNTDINNGDILEFTGIYTSDNKTGTPLTYLNFSNIGGKKSIVGDNGPLQKAYLYFEKEGQEDYILIE